MCRGKVDVSYPSSLTGLKTSHKIHKDGLASSQLLSLLWVLEIDLESPVVESGVNNLCQGRFFVPKKKLSKCFHFLLGHVPFCQSLGLNHWGLLGSGFRLAWEACFDVCVKTRVVQICQVQRQVHPADVFDGGLFVILGWTEQKCFKHGSLHVILGGPKDDKQLGSESQHFLNYSKMSSQTSEERHQFFTWLKMSIPNPCAFWRWRGRGGKNGLNMVQRGRSFWAWRSRFHQVVFPLTKLATICSWRARHSVLLWLPGRIKAFWPWNTLLLRTFQVKVWKKIWKLYCQKVSIICVCIKTSWTNNTVRWISGGETFWGKTLAVFFCRWARQLNDTIILPCAFLLWVEEVFAHKQSDRILLRHHWEPFWVMDGQMIK